MWEELMGMGGHSWNFTNENDIIFGWPLNWHIKNRDHSWKINFRWSKSQNKAMKMIVWMKMFFSLTQCLLWYIMNLVNSKSNTYHKQKIKVSLLCKCYKLLNNLRIYGSETFQVFFVHFRTAHKGTPVLSLS